MRYLILSDIHANLEAFEAVLQDAGSVDGVIFLGDLVGYGPNPNEVTDLLQTLPNVTAISGNHDWAALDKLDLSTFNGAARTAARWTRDRMRPDVREFLATLPPARSFDSLYLAHGSPRDPIWEYLEQGYQGPPNFAIFHEPMGLVGHTHVPRILTEHARAEPASVQMPQSGEVVDLADGLRRIVNPGGVGQPRDGDSRAAYGLWDAEARRFTFRRVPYNVAETQRKILAAGLPASLAARLSLGL